MNPARREVNVLDIVVIVGMSLLTHASKSSYALDHIEDSSSLLQVQQLGSEKKIGESVDEEVYPALEDPKTFDKDFISRDPQPPPPPPPAVKPDQTFVRETPNLKGMSAYDQNFIHTDFAAGMTDSVGLETMVSSVNANATLGLEEVKRKRKLALISDNQLEKAQAKLIDAHNASEHAKAALADQKTKVHKAKVGNALHQLVLSNTAEVNRQIDSKIGDVDQSLQNVTIDMHAPLQATQDLKQEVKKTDDQWFKQLEEFRVAQKKHDQAG